MSSVVTPILPFCISLNLFNSFCPTYRQSPCQLTTWQKASPPAHAKTNMPTTPPYTLRGGTPSYFSTQSHTNKITIYAQSAQTKLPTQMQSTQTKYVGAVPVCPPERPRSGVSIPKYIYASRIMHEDLTMDAPSQGDTGGHTGAAPTHLHHAFPYNPPIINSHFGRVPAKPFII